MNKTIQKIKSINGSVIFMISALAAALYALSLVLTASHVDSFVNEFWKNLSAGNTALAEITKGVQTAFVFVPISVFVHAFFCLVSAAGMWLFFLANKSRSDSVSTVGLTIIKAVKIAEAVVFTLVYLAIGLAVAAVIWTALTLEGEAGAGVYVNSAIAAAVYITFYILAVAYYRGIFRTIKAIKMTIATGVIMGKVSEYVIAVNFAIILYWAAVTIFSPFVMGLISAALQLISTAFATVYLIRLRLEMKRIASRGGEIG